MGVLQRRLGGVLSRPHALLGHLRFSKMGRNAGGDAADVLKWLPGSPILNIIIHSRIRPFSYFWPAMMRDRLAQRNQAVLAAAGLAGGGRAGPTMALQ